MAQEITAYQIKIKLMGTNPLVWRTLEVTSDMSLNGLSWAINLAMGWQCYHLHLFQVNGFEYGNIEEDEFEEWKSDKKLKIRDLVRQNITTFIYMYDFGDGWKHEISIEKEVQAVSSLRYPVCRDGKSACPPEDCGGIGGFTEYKEAISNRKHARHKEFLDWSGPYNPTEFNIQKTNLRMISKKIAKNAKIKSLNKAADIEEDL